MLLGAMDQSHVCRGFTVTVEVCVGSLNQENFRVIFRASIKNSFEQGML